MLLPSKKDYFLAILAEHFSLELRRKTDTDSCHGTGWTRLGATQPAAQHLPELFLERTMTWCKCPIGIRGGFLLPSTSFVSPSCSPSSFLILVILLVLSVRTERVSYLIHAVIFLLHSLNSALLAAYVPARLFLQQLPLSWLLVLLPPSWLLVLLPLS